MITGSISCTASITLIIMILRSNLKLGTVYRRLVFGISIFDLIQSISQALSSVMMPAGSFWGAAGNDITCGIQGLMTVIGVSGATLYSLSLSIYFIAVIKFNMSDRTITSRLEPYLHIVPILYSLVSAVAIYASGLFNPAGAICFIAPNLSTCGNDKDCIDRMEQIFVILSVLFSGGLVMFVFAMNCVAMSVIYWTEYSLSKKNQVYQTSWIQNHQHVDRPSHDTTVEPSPLAARLSRPSRASLQRRKEISKRAIAYIIGYLLTYTPSCCYRVWEFYASDGAPYTLQILSRVFFPLQGLLNIIIYTFPHVLSRYDANNDYSWIRAFWEVVKSGGDKDNKELGDKVVEAYVKMPTPDETV
eukprot:CAMPEP_0203674902 /NCGR_PEP_ID=MMETSP0090-20130426/17887_1 /ASSEMBLY_ACC=CAM_ASM_001088 /TAXON_ID=426623 /ORGANISM="Chaetoceros affinis, Strain CCMP159" /LENGTH=358 /DNA_ID=CAMNT_0050540901 /DNA_START=27 /DNA_END=1104 /DNA_ORIENTATION=+